MAKRSGKRLSKGAIGVALVLILAGFMAYCSEVKAGDSGWSYEGGWLTVGSASCAAAIGISQQIGERWQFGAILHDEGICTISDLPFAVRANLGISISRVFRYGRWQVELGPALFEHGDIGIGDDRPCRSPGWADDNNTVPRSYVCPDQGPQFAFHLRLQFWITDNLYLSIPHYSSGRSAPKNKGKNALMLGWRFR